jgi:tryptophan synthase alpha chain
VTESLADALSRVRASGAKAFVPYATAGLAGVDAALLLGYEAAGADAIEVGIPFSDPVMDGPVIQEASGRALEAGITPADAFALVRAARDGGLTVPVAFMTYLNPILAEGTEAFLDAAVAGGASGVIVPDLPVDEAGDWVAACGARDVAPVLLAAPNSPPERLAEIAAASRGFVYCVSTMGVTGSRQELSRSAEAVVGGLRPLTDMPLLVGVGISTPNQATAAIRFADGVVVGSALVEPMLAGDREETLTRARSFGAALAFAAAGDQE